MSKPPASSSGVTTDSLTSNYEKKNIFYLYNSSHTEAMFYSSIYASIWCIIILFIFDYNMLYLSIIFFLNKPNILLLLIISSIGAYMSVIFILLLIKIYSTTYAECIKGIRKVLSITLSYLLLNNGKSFTILHAMGITCFIISILMTIYIKAKKN